MHYRLFHTAVLTIIIFLILFVTTAWAQAPLTILYTSEHHGTVMPIEQGEYKGLGGVAARATLIEEIRQSVKNLLLLDSGDILVGTAYSAFFRGEPDIIAMNLMGYDAMTAGNHEFDYGLEHFHRLQGLAHFPILCSNLRTRSGEICPPMVIKEVGGLKVGIIGLQGGETFPDAFHPIVAKELIFQDPIQTAKELARRLEGEVDLLIALTHQGSQEDLALARAIPQLDLIIGGHVEGFEGLLTAQGTTPVMELDNPATIVVKTHRLGRTLGRLDLLIQDKKIRWAAAKNLPVIQALPPQKEVAELIARYDAQLKQRTAQVIGKALVALDGDPSRLRTQETNLGNILADMLRKFKGTDVAVINGGLIRASIPAGEITLKQVLQVIPFESTLVTLKLHGSELKEALENSVSRLPQASGRFLQVSGLDFTYDPGGPVGSRVLQITVGGKPLDTNRLYSLTTDNFLAGGGDGYTIFVKGFDRMETQIPIRDLFIQIVQQEPLNAEREGRSKAKE